MHKRNLEKHIISCDRFCVQAKTFDNVLVVQVYLFFFQDNLSALKFSKLVFSNYGLILQCC